MAARAILRLLPGILCQSDGHTASAGASDDVDGATPIRHGLGEICPELRKNGLALRMACPASW